MLVVVAQRIHEPCFNKHQYEFWEDRDTRLLHLSSGYGGGKTHILIWKAIQLSQANPLTHGGLVVPSYPEFTKDVQPELEDIFESRRIKYHFNMKYYYYH